MDASENGIRNAISPGQARAARALIGWTQARLIEATGIPKRTLARFELGESSPQRRTIAASRAALEAAGVEFIPENGGGAGVRLKARSA
jgi:transcriptional regulator with XRE-family HTH domain